MSSIDPKLTDQNIDQLIAKGYMAVYGDVNRTRDALNDAFEQIVAETADERLPALRHAYDLACDLIETSALVAGAAAEGMQTMKAQRDETVRKLTDLENALTDPCWTDNPKIKKLVEDLYEMASGEHEQLIAQLADELADAENRATDAENSFEEGYEKGYSEGVADTYVHIDD